MDFLLQYSMYSRSPQLVRQYESMNRIETIALATIPPSLHCYAYIDLLDQYERIDGSSTKGLMTPLLVPIHRWLQPIDDSNRLMAPTSTDP